MHESVGHTRISSFQTLASRGALESCPRAEGEGERGRCARSATLSGVVREQAKPRAGGQGRAMIGRRLQGRRQSLPLQGALAGRRCGERRLRRHCQRARATGASLKDASACEAEAGCCSCVGPRLERCAFISPSVERPSSNTANSERASCDPGPLCDPARRRQSRHSQVALPSNRARDPRPRRRASRSQWARCDIQRQLARRLTAAVLHFIWTGPQLANCFMSHRCIGAANGIVISLAPSHLCGSCSPDRRPIAIVAGNEARALWTLDP